MKQQDTRYSSYSIILIITLVGGNLYHASATTQCSLSLAFYNSQSEAASEIFIDVGEVTGNIYLLRNTLAYVEDAGGNLIATASVTPGGSNYGIISSNDETLLYVFGVNNANPLYAPFVLALSTTDLSLQQSLVMAASGDYTMSKYMRKDGTRMYWGGSYYTALASSYTAGLLVSWPD